MATKSTDGSYPLTIRLLYCAVCKNWTQHVLTASKDKYVCGCGSVILRHEEAEKESAQ